MDSMLQKMKTTFGTNAYALKINSLPKDLRTSTAVRVWSEASGISDAGKCCSEDDLRSVKEFVELFVEVGLMTSLENILEAFNSTVRQLDPVIMS